MATDDNEDADDEDAAADDDDDDFDDVDDFYFETSREASVPPESVHTSVWFVLSDFHPSFCPHRTHTKFGN